MYANDIIRSLHGAVRTGNLQDVLEMLSKGADVEAADIFKVRPIHIAAEEGHLDILKALIARGCNVNALAACATPLFNQLERGMTPLHFAVRNADPNLALCLISAGAKVNTENSSKVVPLHLAAQHGHLSVVKALVSANADVNAEDNIKVTPLVSAVAQNFEDVAKFLVQNGAVVNARNSERATPLHFAAEMGNVNIAKLLIQNQAAINAKNLEGFTPLHVSIQNRHAVVSQFLINSGADVNATDEEGWTPLHNVAHSGYPAETARLLIAKGASVNAREKIGRTPLHLAAAIDFTDVVNILITNKADVNATDDRMWTPLHSAAYDGHLDTTKILTVSGAKIDARTENQTTPLHFAADYWHVEVVKYLLAKGAEVNARDHTDWTALHFAADEGSTLVPVGASGHSGAAAQDSKMNTVRALIENGADINAKGSNDETALHVAVKYGDLATPRYLLQNGAYYDVTTVSFFGNISVSQIAAMRRNEELNALLCAVENLFKAVTRAKCVEIEKCVKEGAPVNSRSVKYGTPLMYASWKGHLDVVNVLLKNGASITLSNSNGVTPLHYAAKFGHHGILCALLQHGAVYDARTKTGKKTPLHFAQEGGKKEITETLKLIESMFIRVSKKNNTVLKELNELKNVKHAVFLAIKKCKNVNNATLAQIAFNNGCNELCKLFCE
ncbi:ankyrin-1-like [Schistocerca gregaria]|uniref:ankyrin-1-like n=1 Tax=Schistocerca gregaria TaxID=7010 RepID=UPI00211E1A20|nr:ankyrin-1-like [Schistocerca gregaria]